MEEEEDERPRSALSSNGFSVDMQVSDALSWLAGHHPEQFAAIKREFRGVRHRVGGSVVRH